MQSVLCLHIINKYTESLCQSEVFIVPVKSLDKPIIKAFVSILAVIHLIDKRLGGNEVTHIKYRKGK